MSIEFVLLYSVLMNVALIILFIWTNNDWRKTCEKSSSEWYEMYEKMNKQWYEECTTLIKDFYGEKE